jgi:hypothetical protein
MPSGSFPRVRVRIERVCARGTVPNPRVTTPQALKEEQALLLEVG